MTGFSWRTRSRHLALAVMLGVGAMVAPVAAPGQAQGLDIPGPLFPPGMGPFPFPGPGPMPGPLPGPGPMPGAAPGSGLMPTQARATGVNLQALRAINAGDVSGAVVLFAEDATYHISDGVGQCSVTPCVGREAIRRELERQVGVHSRFAPLGGDVTGTHVIGLWDIRSDRVQSAGAQRILGVLTTEMRGDRITSMRIALVRDDPQTQQFITWVQNQAAGASAVQGAGAPAAAAPTVQMPIPPATPTTVPASAPPSPPVNPPPAAPPATDPSSPFATPPSTP
jgi:hypothetical protein